MERIVHTIQISDDLKNMLDQLVAQGFGGTETEVVEEAVRRCAAEFDDANDELVAAVEAGLGDIRDGHYASIEGPDSRKGFWEGIRREVTERIAEVRTKAGRSGT
jgi:predicted transcriptional regulator